ncbi:trehalose-phosphatase [Nocardioides seonyuensis]|uniref:Trehalose 6-phosphate phosphatase n=1 Tax=Nocardioides seonyuensis TaxID=2518371 RepID=A0A4P7ICF3_9ACTN|nr:trehalose-phosphatase [Nocardioides seonyuensis]QBX54795.1 trehalose-phosphatase [Nocardioides seonyuensis]
MEFTSAQARSRFDAVVAVAASTVVGLDFDGTLAPIVDDPEAARIHADASDVLADVSQVVRAIAIVTGRPARQAVDMGALDELGRAMAEHGTSLSVFGQYGNERWSAGERRVVSPRPPRGLASFERELPAVLRSAGAADAFVEEKGLAVGIHTRRMPDPAGAFERLLEPLRQLAERHGLTIEPGRHVIEVRSGDTTKGDAVRVLVEEHQAGGFVFAGDDLGDVEAFEALHELRRDGMPTLAVCSATEQAEVARLADLVVPGPDGVMELLRELAVAARASQRTH